MSDLTIDVSNNNGPVDLAKAKAWGVKAVIAKASEGSTFTDKLFGSNREQARRLNLPFGAYHFFRPGVSPVDQANHFASIVQKLNATDLRPVLDYETGGPQTPAQRRMDIRLFNETVKKRLGAWPIFYTFPGFLPLLELTHPVGDGLWLADFGPDDGTEHPFDVPKPWKKVLLHQFSQKCHIPGHDGAVDLSYGNLKGCLAHPWLANL